MNESEEINELEVELCEELARLYDEEDLTHPPHRQEEDLDAFKERENEPSTDFESFVTSMHIGKEGLENE